MTAQEKDEACMRELREVAMFAKGNTDVCSKPGVGIALTFRLYGILRKYDKIEPIDLTDQ